jgi:hypothetical protein
MIILRKKLDFFTLRASSRHHMAALSWARGMRNTASPMNALPVNAWNLRNIRAELANAAGGGLAVILTG